MKKILIVTLSFININLWSQCGINYFYDGAGNRIRREICVSALTSNDQDQLNFVGSKELVADSILSIQSKHNEDLSTLIIFPNPTTGLFKIKDQIQWENAHMKVYTLNGKILHHIIIKDEAIDLSRINVGQYYIVLQKEDQKKTAKLIITK